MPTSGRKDSDCLCLVGPTGTAKSRVAVKLAERLRGEIINCDSRQVYRDFPVITAQPDQELTRRCPHWLYGFLETHEPCNAGFFAEQALAAIQEVRSRGRWPILVGGTGLYLRSVLQGLAPIPEVSEDVRAEVLRQCREQGPEALHRELSEVDPESAAAIQPRDAQRLTRALEVLRETGQPLSWWQKQERTDRPRLRALKLGFWIELEALIPRLSDRIERMLTRGALEEVREAWRRCPDESAPGWSGIGCLELLSFLRGRTTLEQAKEQWLRKTRAYAKRQMTWFRKEEGLLWLQPGEADRAVEYAARRVLETGRPQTKQGDAWS